MLCGNGSLKILGHFFIIRAPFADFARIFSAPSFHSSQDSHCAPIREKYHLLKSSDSNLPDICIATLHMGKDNDTNTDPGVYDLYYNQQP